MKTGSILMLKVFLLIITLIFISGFIFLNNNHIKDVIVGDSLMVSGKVHDYWPFDEDVEEVTVLLKGNEKEGTD